MKRSRPQYVSINGVSVPHYSEKSMKTADQYKRDAERINAQLDFSKINTLEDYRRAMSEFMRQDVSVKLASAFSKYGDTQNRMRQAKVFREAKGKDLKQDRARTHRVVLTDPQKYKHVGSKRADLIGIDTARKFGYTKLNGKRVRRMIDNNRTRVIQLKPTFKRTYKRTNKTITVRRRLLYEVRVYTKTGRRLSIKK